MTTTPAHENSASRDSIQDRITQYAGDLDYAHIPADVRHAAKTRLIDTLGVLIGGYDGAPCRIARDLAAQMPNAAGATIIGTALKTTPDMAAFVNATTARYAELTDTYHWPGSAYGHPSDIVMPVLAAAEVAKAGGRELITAIVLAYEIFCRLSDGFHNKGFDPLNFACIATAAAAARLFGLTAEQRAHAIAMAAVPNIMLKQVRVDHLTMFKVAASGQAGRSGVFAAMLARAGMEGPHLPFEGRAGWCENIARERFSLETMGDADTPYKILATRFKTRPCAGNTISSVLAAEKITSLKNPGDVERISVEVYKRAKIASGSDAHFWNPDSPGTADHSIPYLVAVALLEGTITPRSFDSEHLRNTAVRGLMARLEVIENEDYTRAYEQLPQAHYTRVTVFMQDGTQCVGQSGGGADDLAADKTDAQIAGKFSSLVKPALGEDGVARALDQLWRLEDMQNVAHIVPLFTFA